MKLLYEDKRSHRLTFSGRSLDFQPHMHHAVEIIFLTRGTSCLHVENDTVRLEAGDVAVVFPNLVHSYENSENTESYMLILPTKPLLSAYAKTLTEMVPVMPCLRRGQWEQSGLLMLVQQAWRDAASAPDAVMQGYYQVIVGKLLSLLELRQIGSGTQNALKTMLLYIHDHYREPLTRSELARVVGYNESYISHVFTETLKTSFTDYIRSLRLQDAAELLSGSDLAVTQIASSLGFGSIRSFNRVFRQEFGTSPRDYRTAQKRNN